MHLMLHIGFYELYRKRHFSEMVASEIILLALFDGIVHPYYTVNRAARGIHYILSYMLFFSNGFSKMKRIFVFYINSE